MAVLHFLGGAFGYIAPFILLLSVLVFVHEMGHFLVGRWCGVKVDAFSLGIGPEICAFVDRRGTRWRLAALPLGGYVKFHGDANAASAGVAENAAAMSDAERRVSFFAQPVGKRAAIVAAGPIANFLLAIIVYAGVFMTYGRPVLTPVVGALQQGEPAMLAGFQPGDRILSIDGVAVEGWTDMQRVVAVSPGEALTFVVQRAGAPVTLGVTPRLKIVSSSFGDARMGVVGLVASNDPANMHVERYGPFAALRLATGETWYVVDRTLSTIGGLFAGRESLNQLSGPVGTGYIAGKVAELGFSALLNLGAILSISIGLLNLFPIPVLDGGHLMYYLCEAVKGRPLGPRAQEIGARIGLTVIVGLMILTTFNDLLRFTRG